MKYIGYYVMDENNDVVELFDYYCNARDYIIGNPSFWIEKIILDLKTGKILERITK